MILALNLVQAVGEPFGLETDDVDIRYEVYEMATTLAESTSRAAPFLRAQSDAARGAALAQMPEEFRHLVPEAEALFIRAIYDADAVPGTREFSIDGTRIRWELQFTDNASRVYFARLVADESQPGPAEVFNSGAEPTAIGFYNDELFVEVATDLELRGVQEIAIDLSLNGQPLGTQLKARRTEFSNRLYRTEPLRLVGRSKRRTEPPESPSAIPIAKGDILLARVADPAFFTNRTVVYADWQNIAPDRYDGFSTRIQGWDFGVLELAPSPELAGANWDRALRDAAACRPELEASLAELDYERFRDYLEARHLRDRNPKESLPAYQRYLERMESGRFKNWILTELETYQIPILLRQHAAVILLEERLREQMMPRAPELRALLRRLANGELESVRADLARRVTDGSHPLFDLPDASPPVPFRLETYDEATDTVRENKKNFEKRQLLFEKLIVDSGVDSKYFDLLVRIRYRQCHRLRATKQSPYEYLIDGLHNIEETVPFRYALLQDTWDTELFLGYYYGGSRSAAESWAGDALVEGLPSLLGSIDESMKHIDETKNCDLRELLFITGRSVGAVGDSLKQRLLLWDENAGAYKPNLLARQSVDSLPFTVDALEAQEAYSSIDTAVAISAAGVAAGFPAIFTNAVWASTLALATDVLDLAADFYMDAAEYRELERQRRFLMGVSPLDFIARLAALVPGRG